MIEMKNAVLRIKIIPRSSRSEFVEIMEDGTIKIRLSAPPVEGKANKALVEFLSRMLVVKREDISILSGQTNRTKMISVLNTNREILLTRITKWIK